MMRTCVLVLAVLLVGCGAVEVQDPPLVPVATAAAGPVVVEIEALDPDGAVAGRTRVTVAGATLTATAPPATLPEPRTHSGLSWAIWGLLVLLLLATAAYGVWRWNRAGRPLPWAQTSQAGDRGHGHSSGEGAPAPQGGPP